MTGMRMTVMWEGTAFPSLEHCRIDIGDEGIKVHGMVVALDGGPIRFEYRIACDVSWTVRRLQVAELESGIELTFVSDGDGHWSDGTGEPLPAFDGCVDVDLTATPFTNTLPIRRLGLEPGDARDLRILYVLLPAMEARPANQRYTCLEWGEAGGRYRYESEDFSVDLPIDPDGLVRDYPGYWRRVWPEA